MSNLLVKDKNYFETSPTVTSEDFKKYLVNIIYKGSDRDYYVNGNTIINATFMLGEELTNSQSIKSKYNIFGIFDTLDKYTNRWEHQGYVDRQNFRNVAIATYAIFSTLSQLACKTMMEDDSLSQDDKRYIQSKIDSLTTNAEAVDAMYTRCAVVQHPNLRIYRNILEGVPDFVLSKDVGVSSMRYAISWEEFSLNNYPNYSMKFITGSNSPAWGKLDTPTWAGGVTEIWTHQVAEETYRKIFKDYGGNTSLYNIFFDKNKGNFNNLYSYIEGPSFIGNYYKLTEISGIRALDCHITTNQGQTQENRLGLKSSLNGGPNNISMEHFFSIQMYLGKVDQGMLKSSNALPETKSDGLISGMGSFYHLPYSGGVTLSVEEKTGCTYKWMVNKGDGLKELSGETNTTLTLPALEASMNGYQYSCYIIDNGGVDISDYSLADPVTLHLTGEGVPAQTVPPVEKVHEVASVQELTDALEKVNKGDWNEHTLKLMADIEYPLPITIIEYGVQIDLNGYTLNVNPDSSAQPNIEPEGSTAAIAAVYVDNYGFLDLAGKGALNVVADDGVTYGVYAAGNSSADITTVTSTNCECAVYATDGSTVNVDRVSATGENTYGVECYGKSTVNVSGSVTASGKSSGGVYVDGWNENANVSIGGDIIVSGENSRGAFVSGESATLHVDGSVTVTNGAAGVVSGNGSAVVGGNITAPVNAVNAWNGADVTVKGNVVSTDEDAAAVSSSGADVHIFGDVHSTGKGGTGLSAAAWDLNEPAVGAKVTVDGKINASTPLTIENLPVEESKHIANTTKEGYDTFTDGTSIVWVKPNSFVKTVKSDSMPNPQTGDDSLPLTLWLLLGAGVFALATRPLRKGKTVRHM